LQAIERARLREDLSATVPHAEELVSGFTGLAAGGFRSRAWVMSRGEWVATNLRGLQRLLEPLARRMLAENARRSDLRRKALGAQIGVLLGYVSKKVLGQYDVFLPPDDEGLLYFVGPNLAETERRFALPAHDFRMWVAIHEVTHRVQFGATPWLRGYLNRMVNTYLDTVQLDAREMLAQLRRAVAEARVSTEWRSANLLMFLMTPEQRDLFHRMQAMMSLLEGHASFVMDEVARDHVRDLPRLRRSLKERRSVSGMEKTFQRAIGFDSKIRQYSSGEAFVRAVHGRGGMRALNLVWLDEANLPTFQEIAQPERWLARVAGG
jgi:coenzyme F420 biosynthesis associated uncharacterized protein